MLEYVKESIVSSQVSHENQSTKEINTKIAAGLKKYWSLKEIMKSKDYFPCNKKKDFQYLYTGCETRVLSVIHRDKLQRWQRSMEHIRIIVKINSKINIRIIRKTILIDIVTEINWLKFCWA